MKQQRLGASDLVVGRIAYGCMRIARKWAPSEVTPAMQEEGKASLRAAYEAGCTLFDHADIYSSGVCEEIHGELLRESPSLRAQTVIATKCGVRRPGDPNPSSPHRYDFSRGHIIASVEGSLQRLGVDCIDLYQLHRPDYLMNPAEIGDAFAQLHEQGKVRWFGVSNMRPAQVSALQSGLLFPLVVQQVEIHLGRLDCLEDGTLDQCLERSITPLSWSPLGGGWLAKSEPAALEGTRAETAACLDAIARERGATRAQIALAWLLEHPAGIIPIVGSTRPEAIRESALADQIVLGREDWYRLLRAAQGRSLP